MTYNFNGQLVTEVLQNFQEPVTARQLVNEIASLANVSPKDVSHGVKETLNGGLRYGFIQRLNRRYCTNDVYHALLEQKKSVKSVGRIEKKESVSPPDIHPCCLEDEFISDEEEEEEYEEYDDDDEEQEDEQENETSPKSAESVFSCQHNCCCRRKCEQLGHRPKSSKSNLS